MILESSSHILYVWWPALFFHTLVFLYSFHCVWQSPFGSHFLINMKSLLFILSSSTVISPAFFSSWQTTKFTNCYCKVVLSLVITERYFLNLIFLHVLIWICQAMGLLCICSRNVCGTVGSSVIIQRLQYYHIDFLCLTSVITGMLGR